MKKKWKHQYNTGERGNHKWYCSIITDVQLSLSVPKLIIKQIFLNESRHILSIIIWLFTGPWLKLRVVWEISESQMHDGITSINPFSTHATDRLWHAPLIYFLLKTCVRIFCRHVPLFFSVFVIFLIFQLPFGKVLFYFQSNFLL